MRIIVKWIVPYLLITLVTSISEPYDPCTNFQNPQSFTDCNSTQTIFPNSVCCLLTSTKNDQTFNACFPSYYGSSRSYTANGISATFRCSGNFINVSVMILAIYLLNVLFL
jgi:hypothetical protein